MSSTEEHDPLQTPGTDVGSIEQKPPPLRGAGLGVQQVLVSNAWLDPIFIAGVAGFSTALATNLVTATFIAAGVTTFVQTTKLVRLPIFEGPSSAFSPLAIAYAKAGTLAAAGTGLLIGAGLTFLLAATGLLSRIRSIFTAAVTGTIITLVGVALAGYTFMQFFGMPGTDTFGTFPSLLIACTTTSIVLIGGALKGRVRAFCFIIALLAGDLLALAFGRLDFSPVSDAPWLALPKLLPYGSLTFDLGITLTMTIVFLVAVIEAIGMYEATATFTRTKLSNRQLNAGVAGEAGGSMLSALVGGFGTTAYAQNLGVVRITGVASRHVMRIAALLMIALAFVPKLAAALVATPSAVIGGLFLPAAATVVMTGIGMIARDRTHQNHNLVGPMGIMAGLGIPPLAEDLTPLVPQVIADLLPHQIVIGTIAVIFFELVLVKIPTAITKHRTQRRSGGRS